LGEVLSNIDPFFEGNGEYIEIKGQAVKPVGELARAFVERVSSRSYYALNTE
jgi:hypothetical protein